MIIRDYGMYVDDWRYDGEGWTTDECWCLVIIVSNQKLEEISDKNIEHAANQKIKKTIKEDKRDC